MAANSETMLITTSSSMRLNPWHGREGERWGMRNLNQAVAWAGVTRILPDFRSGDLWESAPAYVFISYYAD
jgi:hypothetical protein